MNFLLGRLALLFVIAPIVELMLLIESDKRSRAWATRLATV
mgnify:CR=1 FL=1